MSKKLYVGNVATECTEDEIRGLFETVGTVVECDKIKQFAFVHMASAAEAQSAIKQLNGQLLMGRTIKVQLSTTDVHKDPGIGSSGECFRCGESGHWSRSCPKDGPRKQRDFDGGRGRGGFRGRGGHRGRGGQRGGGGQRGRGGGFGWGSGGGWGEQSNSYWKSGGYDGYGARDPYSSAGVSRRELELELRLEDAYRKLALVRELDLLRPRYRDRSPLGRSALEYSRDVPERPYDPLLAGRSSIYDMLGGRDKFLGRQSFLGGGGGGGDDTTGKNFRTRDSMLGRGGLLGNDPSYASGSQGGTSKPGNSQGMNSKASVQPFYEDY